MDSCPKQLKPFEKAYTERRKQLDNDMFTMGRYVYEAVVVGVDNALRGNKSRASYRDKSFTEEAEEMRRQNSDTVLVGKDLRIERQRTIDGLNALKARFEAGRLRRKGEVD